jgi:hypothetical protein
MRPPKAYLKVCTGRAFVATMDGGDLGFSLTRKRAGAARHMVKMHWIRMKLKNFLSVSPIGDPFSSSSWVSSSLKMRRMRI